MAGWRGWEGGGAPAAPGRAMARGWAVAGSVGLHGAALAVLLLVIAREEPPRVVPVTVSIAALPPGTGDAPPAAPELEAVAQAAAPAEQAEAAPEPVAAQAAMTEDAEVAPRLERAAPAPEVEAAVPPDTLARAVPDAPAPDAPPIEPDVAATAAPAETAEIPLMESQAAEPPPPVQAALPLPPPPPPPAPPARAPAPPRTAAATPRPAARPVTQPVPQPGSGAAAPASPAGAPPAAASDDAPLVLSHASFRRPPTPPSYPLRARELGMEGEVVVRCLLDRDGTPGSVTLARSSGHALLDEAALAAVRRWAFEPGRRGGVPVPAIVQIPVRFALR